MSVNYFQKRHLSPQFPQKKITDPSKVINYKPTLSLSLSLICTCTHVLRRMSNLHFLAILFSNNPHEPLKHWFSSIHGTKTHLVRNINDLLFMHSSYSSIVKALVYCYYWKKKTLPNLSFISPIGNISLQSTITIPPLLLTLLQAFLRDLFLEHYFSQFIPRRHLGLWNNCVRVTAPLIYVWSKRKR